MRYDRVRQATVTIRGLGSGLALLAAGSLSGCATQLPAATGLPSLYQPMTAADAHLDVATARDMISAYRARTGQGPLQIDPALQKLAEAEAVAMAAADRPSRAQTVKSAVERLGYAPAEANLSAGYHTLAEAFSGWRDSPSHNATMLAPSATRMGIATAYAPGSKYKVYWALLVAK
ncbi:CAP domain-containing protein [Methylobacterium sp. BTF04]|uniref:CAP domain-containing protein n=1 Tax=Methylobacterium sp. BTF04 TaxID=2708300 RepID=UPI0013D4EE95|nr:CAP domain-containing protein [Methylobacterium sp. BTF04]NEU11485.1 CAP domain-containing protein [Methylobacterium sp. BTF04]